jgi:hypothetical protein
MLINLRKGMKGAVKANKADNFQPWPSAWWSPQIVNFKYVGFQTIDQPLQDVKPRLLVNPQEGTSEGVLNFTTQEAIRQKTINFIMANETIFKELENSKL